MTNPLEIGKSPQPTLHVIEGALQGQSIPLKAPEMKLGREGGDIDLSLYTQMSRIHSRIFLENGVWNVQDLGSTNGTHVNGERVVSRRLQDGDVLKLGNFSARISLPGQPRSAAASGSALTQVAPDIIPMPPPTQRLPHQAPPVAPTNPWPTQGPPPVPQAYPPPAAYPPPQQYPTPIPPPQYSPPPAIASNGLSTIGQTLSTVAMCLMCVGLLPCLGWLNWFTIPIGGISAVISLIALVTDQNAGTRNNAVIGLILGLIAAGVGTFRLIMGGGIC